MQEILQQAINAAGLGSVYVLFSLGFSLQLGVLHIFNGAQNLLYALAGIFFLTALGHTGSLLVSIIIGLALTVVAGLVVERVAVRPLSARGTLVVFVATLGLAQAAGVIVHTTLGQDPRAIPLEHQITAQVSFWGLSITAMQIASFVIAIASVGALMFMMRSTALGRAMHAVAQNPRDAGLIGVNPASVFRIVFAITSLAAGAAGILSCLSLSQVNPKMDITLEIIGFAVVLLGGMGSLLGTAVASYLVAGVVVVANVLGYSTLALIAPYAILYVVLIVRPQGLFGQLQRVI